MRTVRPLAAFVLAAGLTLVGCSSGDDASTAAETSAEVVKEAAQPDETATETANETSEETVEESAEDSVEESVEEIEVAEEDTPYFYGFGCQGAAETLLDMAAYFGEFDPAAASSEDADTFRALGEAMVATADLPEEGAAGAGVTAADQYIYAAGVSAIELADVIDDAGFTRDIEEFTGILGENATLAVQECGLD